jgi:hypothetical protein
LDSQTETHKQTRKDLPKVIDWLENKSDSHTFAFSGDGGTGNANLMEALLITKSPAGFWFLHEPDDFREIERLIRLEH